MKHKNPEFWPYYFCPNCSKLAPVQILSGTKFCIKCSYTFEKDEGGRLVLLDEREARLRRLCVVKDDTGELDD